MQDRPCLLPGARRPVKLGTGNPLRHAWPMSTSSPTPPKQQANPRLFVVAGVLSLTAAVLFTVDTFIGERFMVVPAAMLSLSSGLQFGRLVERGQIKRGLGR